MRHEEHIGFQIKTLSNLMKRLIDQNVFQGDAQDMTGMHGWIIGYLYDHREEDIFQRDIQERFSVRRSTVTGVLQLMEKKGLITRESVGSDARLKKIRLTPKAEETHLKVMENIKRTEDRVSAGFTPEEKETFFRLCDKIRKNIE